MEETRSHILLPLLTVTFVIGILGNIAVLYILYKWAKRRNAKHVLLLRCLATNDLVSQLGMLTLRYLQALKIFPLHTECVLFVLIRAFGLGSGSVALVMAIERWLALTKPFFYQQYVTYPILKKSVLTLWCLQAFLTCLPLSGFGFYYQETSDDNKNSDNETNVTLSCSRYREANLPKDIIYAYVYFAYGTTVCLCIVFCNTMVFRSLARIGSQKKVLVRRVSRSMMNNKVGKSKQYATVEELAFAKVMAYLCIIFIVCWSPQLILIPFAQINRKHKAYRILGIIADVLMCIYFTIDPYVYVLQQYMEKGILRLPFKRQATSSSLHNSTPMATPTAILLNEPSFSSAFNA